MPLKPKIKPKAKPFDWKRNLIGVIGLAVLGVLGLTYCEMVYRNGADPLKDGGLMAGVALAVKLYDKFVGG